jgi:LuxR family quorum-sensing system transcriptional regulator SolR
MDCWRRQQLSSLSHTPSDEAFLGELVSIAADLGFDYCAYIMRSPVPMAAPRLAGLNNYPAAWQRRYAENNYGAIDPTLARGAASVLPFVWNEELFAATPAFRADARAHGLEVGWSQSCYDGKGAGGLLTLARRSGPVTDVELRQKTHRMSWLAQVTHETLAERMLAKLLPESSVCLTTREIDVLRWTADGRTSSEVSAILAISERTVNFHINNTLAKLNALNKTAAVVKAARLGLL